MHENFTRMCNVTRNHCQSWTECNSNILQINLTASNGSIRAVLQMIFNTVDNVPDATVIVSTMLQALNSGAINLDVDATVLQMIFNTVDNVPDATAIVSTMLQALNSGAVNLDVDTTSPTPGSSATSGGPSLKMIFTTALCLPVFFAFITGLLFRI
ncbi:hypothetical protein CRUP_018880 [Coryphaenoides rupestris]|nr:hypothetical protein CRUP_018880 [Coryphaenoides rupestris]